MSDQVVLVVEKNDRIRAAICNAFKARYVPTFDVAHAFDAMSALGRASFGAVVVTPGKRQLSLRGFCTLARRRHPDLQLFVIVEPGTPVAQVEQAIGVSGVQPVNPSTTVEQLATRVCTAMDEAYSKQHGTELQSAEADAIDAFDIPMTPASADKEAEAFDVPLTPTVDIEPDPTPVPAPTSTTDEDVTAVRAMVGAQNSDSTSPAAPAPITMPPPNRSSPPQELATVTTSNEEADGGHDEEASALAKSNDARSFSVPLPITAMEAFEELSEPPGEYTPAAPTTAPPAWSSPAEYSAKLPNDDAAPIPLEDVMDGPSLPVTEEGPLLEGTLHEKAGPALLLSLAAQELTGILTLDSGPMRGRIYLHRGEPVWATPDDGDAGLFALLKAQKKIPENAEFPNLPDGQLVAHLSAAGFLEGKDLYEFMLGFVRERLIGLIAEESASYAFYDDVTFVEVAPLLTVNPFGIVFECKRRELSPDRLLALGGEMEWKYLHPLPALLPAMERIKPFARGMDLGRFINGTRTMRAFCEHTGLDVIMGTLMLLALEEARLVSIKEHSRDLEEEGVQLAETTGVHNTIRLPTTDAAFGSDDENAAEPTPAEQEFLSLYMRLKPLKNPYQLLGISNEASTSQMRNAYEGLLAKLDPLLVPAGSAQALLRENVRQLREKVTSAFEAISEPNSERTSDETE